MVLTNKNFRLFVDCIDEKTLLDSFNENSSDLIPTIFNQRNIPLTLDNIIEYCYKGIGLSAGTFHDFSYYEDKEDDHLCLLFRHNFGIKWSRVLADGIAYQIESTLGYHVIPASVSGLFIHNISGSQSTGRAEGGNPHGEPGNDFVVIMIIFSIKV